MLREQEIIHFNFARFQGQKYILLNGRSMQIEAGGQFFKLITVNDIFGQLEHNHKCFVDSE